MLKGLPAVAMTTAITQINGFVDAIIASNTVSGAVACLNYGHRLMNVFSGMISAAIGTATYPTMVQYIAEKRTDKLRELVTNIICVLSFFIVPISLFCVVFSEELVTIAFQRGAFDAEATKVTAGIFGAYCIGMLFIGLSPIITNVFYSYGNTRIALWTSILDIVLNIFLNLWFCSMWGVVGLAMATSISAIVCFIVRMFCLKRYMTLDYKPMVVELLKIVLASVCSVGGAFACCKWFGTGNIYLFLLVAMLCSLLIFFVLAKVFRISAMVRFLSMLRGRFSKKV